MEKTKNKGLGRLTTMMASGVTTGAIPMAALAGLFTLQNTLFIGAVMIAGTGAVITAIMLEGSLSEKIITAMIAGGVATMLVVFAAVMGPRLLDMIDINILKVAGGISVLLIGFLIMGLKIPDNLPLIVVGVGIAASIFVKLI